jgi:hypothetical protein
MNYRRMTRLGVALAMFIVMAVPVSVLASENERTPAAEPTPALFEGDLIDMSSDWDGAGACMVWPEAVDTPECFRTEAEMDKRIAELERQLPQAEADIRQTLGSAATKMWRKQPPPTPAQKARSDSGLARWGSDASLSDRVLRLSRTDPGAAQSRFASTDREYLCIPRGAHSSQR